MEFTSIYYLIFITITLIFFRLCSSKIKPYLLILSSFIFIGLFTIESLLALLFGIISTHLIAKKIEDSKNEFQKKLFFTIGLTLIITSLFILKYIESNQFKLSYFKTNKLILFMGISFYGLQNIAYLIDIYYGRIKITSLKKFTLFSSLFSKFTAGPITTIQEFKIESSSKNNSQLIQNGINRIGWGLFKKMVIADRIAPIIAFNFESKNPTLGLTNLVLAYLFTIQLYFDFSGYSDIAIGTSKLFGINLPENFNLPLRSKSISEFWRKWHISLSNWLTKYIFYPISFRYRKTKHWGIIIAIITTFLISGIWHGIYMTFIIYALLHASYLIVETLIKKPSYLFSHKIFSFLSILVTFNLVSLGFIFFRSTSIEQSFSKIKYIFNFNFFPENILFDFTQFLSMGGEQENVFNLYITLLLMCLSIIFERKLQNIFNSKKLSVIGLTIILLLITFFGIFDTSKNFIYTQF